MKKTIHKYLKKTHVKIICIIVVLFMLSPVIYSFSRYIANIVNDYYLESKNFYFNSNRVKQSGSLYKINNWTGVGDFSLDISVNSRKNAIHASDFDITYNVTYTCPADVICTLNKNSGTIYHATNDDDFRLTITPQRAFNDGESVTVHIAAISQSPYIKKIEADFQMIVGKRGVTYEITDETNRPYLMVAITNAITSYKIITAFDSYSVGDEIDMSVYRALSDVNKAKCASAIIMLSFDPNIVLLDTTSSVLNNATTQTQLINGVSYVREITFKVDAMSSYEVRFYKKTPSANYSYHGTGGPPIITFNAVT